MSVEATSWVWTHSPYKGTEKLIHLALADSANDMHGFRIFARQAWVAEKVDCDRMTVNRWLKKAIENGYLALLADNSQAGKPNEYRFLMPSTPARWDPKRGVRPEISPPGQECGGGETTGLTGCDISSQGGETTDLTETEVETEGETEPTTSSLPQPLSEAEGEELSNDRNTEGQSGTTGVSGPASAKLSPESTAGWDTTITPEADEAEASDSGATDDSTGRLPEYTALCDLLADLIADHGVKRPNAGTKRWYDAVRMLVERDGYTVQQVETIIRWAQNDEFWCTNILSTPKLRTQFTQLRLKRNQDIERRKGGGGKDQTAMDRLKAMSEGAA